MTDVLPAIVYGLCLVTSIACAWLLARSFWHSGDRTLLWSSICFTLLAANNLVLVLDLVVWPHTDLRLLRAGLQVVAVSALIWGFLGAAEEDAI